MSTFLVEEYPERLQHFCLLLSLMLESSYVFPGSMHLELGGFLHKLDLGVLLCLLCFDLLCFGHFRSLGGDFVCLVLRGLGGHFIPLLWGLEGCFIFLLRGLAFGLSLRLDNVWLAHVCVHLCVDNAVGLFVFVHVVLLRQRLLGNGGGCGSILCRVQSFTLRLELHVHFVYGSCLGGLLGL